MAQRVFEAYCHECRAVRLFVGLTDTRRYREAWCKSPCPEGHINYWRGWSDRVYQRLKRQPVPRSAPRPASLRRGGLRIGACPRCEGTMGPDEDNDERCLACGHRVYAQVPDAGEPRARRTEARPGAGRAG